MQEKDRFITIHSEGNALTNAHKVVLADKETGVNYLFIQSGYAGGLTPLLDSDGKLVVTPFSEKE